MKNWLKQLKENNIFYLENELLSKHTSWKIGGPVDAFIQPVNKEELIKLLKILKENDVKWKIIGNGSNILVTDKGYRGAIISLKSGFREVVIKNNLIYADAGISLVQLANLAARNKLTGLEFATGIPGTIGGAITMNAGAHGSDISKILQEAEVLLENGEIIVWEKEDFKFEYRSSILHRKDAIVLSSTFNLENGVYKRIISDMEQYKERRKKTQPYNYPCSGSIFRNPSNDYAGRLIEELGLKGYKIGGAQVSTLHSNFIVNIGNAKSSDVLLLINYIKDKVYKKYNIELNTEVEVIGEQ